MDWLPEWVTLENVERAVLVANAVRSNRWVQLQYDKLQVSDIKERAGDGFWEHQGKTGLWIHPKPATSRSSTSGPGVVIS